MAKAKKTTPKPTSKTRLQAKAVSPSKKVVGELVNDDEQVPEESIDVGLSQDEFGMGTATPAGIPLESSPELSSESSSESSLDFMDLDENIGRDNAGPADLDEVKESNKRTPTVQGKTSDLLGSYLSQIRQYPLLSKEQETDIAKKYFESKDPEAAQKLVQANLRFVVKIAAEYSKFGARMIDLIQEGNVGLMHAVKEFNPYKGARLITYAVWWIRGYIQEYLMRQYSIVRIGTTQNQRKLFYQLQREKEALEIMGREPNIALLSSRLGIPEEEISQMAQRMSGRDVSLDKPINSESTVSLGDLQRMPSDESLDETLAREEQLALLNKKIDELRPTLNEREKILLEERILNDEPLTLQEIGEKYGITREAVRQAEVRLMKKIKDKMDPKRDEP
jgi:RNA polymerase sigma-32 factor